VQVNKIFVPLAYCALVDGIDFAYSSLATHISDLFLKLEAIVYNKGRQEHDKKCFTPGFSSSQS
jgi:hypothetical protein